MSKTVKTTIRSTPYEGLIEGAILNKYKIKRFDINEKNDVIWQGIPLSQEQEEQIPPYFPSDDLKSVVQYARLLNRPLLIRGEPGCGKTKLAQAIAYELYKDSEKNYRDYYFEWHIKSTTKAQEGLFTYDHLARLRAIHEFQHRPALSNEGNVDDSGKEVELDKNKENKGIDKKKFRSFGPLGKAILSSTEDYPAILLIDEIDKADIDFPNDLLLELDQKRFYIEETNEEFFAKAPPIIIITSNDEKELPNAFLRRCVFHYIEFPNRELLLKIVDAKVKEIISEFKKTIAPKAKVSSKQFQEEIVDIFRGLLEVSKNNQKTDKAPSTSELLDWLKVIHFTKLKDPSKLSGEKMPEDDLLSVEVLFKSLDDQIYARKNYKQVISMIQQEKASKEKKNK